jgi:hypothetical protein
MMNRTFNVDDLSSVAIALAISLATEASATVIYREIFPNNSSSNEELNTEGWQIHFGSGAQVDDGAVDNINSPSFSTPNNLDAVNSNPTINYPSDGYAFTFGSTSGDYLFWTNEYTVDRSVWNPTEISWYQAHADGNASRAALQIAGQWYASQQTFTNTSTNTDAMDLEQLDFTSATWLPLDFTPGSSLSLGGSTIALPGGNITAFGVYTDFTNDRLRLDTFQIDALEVPPLPLPSPLPACY